MTQRYLLVDTETTGLDPNRHACLEIGAAVLDDKFELVPEAVFHSYIRPGPSAIIDGTAIQINGHGWAVDATSATYLAAPQPHEAWKHFFDWLAQHFAEDGIPKQVIPVGWNVGFDVGFLRRLWCEYLMTLSLKLNVQKWTQLRDHPLKGHGWPMHYHIIDLIGVCRYLDVRAGRSRKGYKLSAIADEVLTPATRDELHLKFGAAHTALADAYMALHVVRALEA